MAKSKVDLGELVGMNEVAALLNCSKPTAIRLGDRQQYRMVRVGRQLFGYRGDVERLRAQREQLVDRLV